jgi:RNA polymerase sigma factor (sigma-70 family)
MNQHQWSDQEIISRVKDNGTREEMLYNLFVQLGWRDAAIGMAMKYGASKEDAEEVAEDALIGLDKNIRNNRFEGKSSLKTYFLNIVKLQWFKRVSRRGKVPTQELLENMSPADAPLDLPSEAEKQAYELALAQIGERCKRLLTLSIIEDESMKEVATKFGLSSPEMAKKEAYRCRLRMREFLLKHPAWLERLKGLR